MLAHVHALSGAVYHSGFYEPEYAVGEHFSVQAKVLMMDKFGSECVRKCAYAHLQAGSVGYELSTVLTYERLCRGRLRETHGLERRVVLDENVNALERNEVTMRVRHILIDHSNHCLRAFDRRIRRIHGSAEGHVSVCVGQGNGHHRDITWQCAATVESSRLAQMHGDIVGITLIRAFSCIRAYEKTLVEEYS